MSMPTVQTDLLGPTPVVLIDSRIPRIFNIISDEDQRGLVSQLEDFIEEVKADGSIPHLLHLGVLSPQNMDEKHIKKDHLLEKCCWQLAQLYRFSTPSRIAEAVPAIQFVSEIYQRENPDVAVKKDVVPMLYLGVALSRSRKHDDEALNTLEQALAAADLTPDQNLKNTLWGRAEYSRLLRRFGKMAEAEAQESHIRSWLLGHPYTVQHSELKALISDEGATDPNHILGHADMSDFFGPSNVTFQGINMGMMHSQF
ncbi:hypothetical protein BDZ94DRAFT_1263047 [Collybia nuda]|uniref:Uncharacterized protein n=1 Tax=Collybia nuda TaxID=64659 RepID=A0A9P5Y616_9AGAR|nr:hypothetical protein BDZ94DRAFT_1263047 [Collybia nuda]